MITSYQHHAYIQVAPSSEFESLATSFASSLLGSEQDAMQRVAHGNHPDFVIVKPLDKRVYISVDQIRALTEVLSLHPYEGGRRAIVIYPADMLRLEAQNSLLKTLEEPPLNTVFLLLTEYPARLLPTIQSRCLTLRNRSEHQNDCEAANTLLIRLERGEDGMGVASEFPKDRTKLNELFIQMIEAAHGSLSGTKGGIYARVIQHAEEALRMTKSNLNTELCAQWFCLRVKGEFNK